MYDLVVIGAGLHALTLLCTLLEDSPMAQKLIDATGGATRSKRSERTMREKLVRRKKIQREGAGRILVVDRFGRWLENWKRQFEVLGIENLRSNAALHPDPFDPEMLFEFARMQGYSTEEAFEEIMEIPRGKKFVGPFQVPRTEFFNQFCEYLIDSYHLRDTVLQGEVESIEPTLDVSGISGRVFKLWMRDGRFVEGRKVVVSIGHSNLPKLPDWVDRGLCPSASLVHAWELVHQDLSGLCLEGERVAVVGGGLTAVQLVQLAERHGCRKVYLISRRRLSIRPFDSDLTWSGRLRHEKLQKFWKESEMQKRMEMIREARKGGTITPSASKALSQTIQAEKCVPLEGVEIWDAEWNGCCFCLELSNHECIDVEKIWLATGSAIDATQEPLFGKIREQFPVECCEGYPVLDACLRWHPDLELYFMGGYASLALGPDGVNLAGARRAAFRLRKQFRDFLLSGSLLRSP